MKSFGGANQRRAGIASKCHTFCFKTMLQTQEKLTRAHQHAKPTKSIRFMRVGEHEEISQCDSGAKKVPQKHRLEQWFATATNEFAPSQNHLQNLSFKENH